MAGATLCYMLMLRIRVGIAKCCVCPGSGRRFGSSSLKSHPKQHLHHGKDA